MQWPLIPDHVHAMKTHADLPDSLKLIINGEFVIVDGAYAMRPLLDFLREDCRQTGTKEGCRSGECGACTVLVVDKHGSRTCNACITLLAQVNGCAVVTVEGVPDLAGSMLHPVQAAMIDASAAQCGFCTPGMVMALVGAAVCATNSGENDPSASQIDSHAKRCLSGNLCRCTGYQPILNAARVVLTEAFATGSPVLSAPAVDPASSVVEAWFTAEGVRVFEPRDLAELLNLRSLFPGATLLAGGTDLVPFFQQRREAAVSPAPSEVILLRMVSELSGVVRQGDGRLRIGAGTTVRETMTALVTVWPEAADYLRRFGSPAINASGTLGGNLCTASPVGDFAPLLLALDATLTVISRRGERALNLQAFFTGHRKTALADDEVLLHVTLPNRVPGSRLLAAKSSRRFDQDVTAVSLVCKFVVQNGRMHDVKVAAGGVAATVLECEDVARMLESESRSKDVIERAARALEQLIMPIDDIRGSASFRRRLVGNLLRRLRWFDVDGVHVDIGHWLAKRSQ